MYGCTTVGVFAFSVLVLSTGFTVAPSKTRIPHHKALDCTETDHAIKVKCRSERQKGTLPSKAPSQSSCCFVDLLNSSHPRSTCTAEDEKVRMSTNAKTSNSAARSQLSSYRLRACEGLNVQLQCNASCSDVIRWRSGDGTLFDGRTLLIQNVQRGDDGSYSCEVADFRGRIRLLGLVRVEVQFAPVITVPNTTESIIITTDDTLECQSEANPRPTITWYHDSAPVDPSPSSLTVSSESSDCKMSSFVLLNIKNSSNDAPSENFTCVAENELGRASFTFLITSFTEKLSDYHGSGGRRRFNVTGFILGMLPPLLISFYIILKLGYRSRYAVERGEDDGYGEEPFFISY